MIAHISTITEVGPSGHGAISGFEIRCADCAFVARTSLRSIAQADAVEHNRWAYRAVQAQIASQRVKASVAR